MHVGLEQYDAALDWLDQAVDDGHVWTLHCAKALPNVDPVRNHPRFTALGRRLGLEP